jgi:hypothetical protein
MTEPDTEMHYVASNGGMLHAVPQAVGRGIKGSSDPDEVTCEICKELLVRPVHLVRENGNPLHPAHDGDGATYDESEVTCTVCQNLISAGALTEPEPEDEEQDEEQEKQ